MIAKQKRSHCKRISLVAVAQVLYLASMDTRGILMSFIILSFATSASARFMGDSSLHSGVEALTTGDANGDTQALLDAWNKACATPGFSTVTVEAERTLILDPISFEGPCKSTNIHFQVLGDIEAPNYLSTMSGMGDIHWIKFHRIDGLTINGTGQIMGKGTNQALGILNCNNVILNGLKIVNPSGKHINIVECIGVHISQLTITAPGDRPNTDGIHIERSQHVEILSSTIGTGDDCISIGGGTSDVNISHINCGPGHGISIGSLGDEDSEVAVEQIHVSFCNFYNTMYGARIKTWQGGSGFARNIIFENLNFTNVDQAITIDQYYCNGHHNCGNETAAVKVSDVHFVGVQGTTTADVPIYLACSQTVTCTGIVLDNVQLKSEKKMTSYCLNVQGNVVDPVTPEVTCLA